MLTRYSFYGVTLELILVMGLFLGALAAIAAYVYWVNRSEGDVE